MKLVLAALGGALGTTLRHWRLAVLLWVLTALAAWAIAAPVERAIHASLLHNPLSNGLLAQFDNEVWVDFHNVQGEALASARMVARAMALPWVLLWTILSVGIVARVADRERNPGFFAACARFGHRGVWILACTLLAIWPVTLINGWLGRLVTWWMVDVSGNGAGPNMLGWGMTLKTLFSLALLGLVLGTGRIARLRVVMLDERFVPKSWVAAFWSLLRRLHLLGPALLASLLPVLVAMLVWSWLSDGLFAADASVWRLILAAQLGQLLFQAALIYRTSVEARLWPMLAPAAPAPPEPPTDAAPIAASSPPVAPTTETPATDAAMPADTPDEDGDAAASETANADDDDDDDEDGDVATTSAADDSDPSDPSVDDDEWPASSPASDRDEREEDSADPPSDEDDEWPAHDPIPEEGDEPPADEDRKPDENGEPDGDDPERRPPGGTALGMLLVGALLAATAAWPQDAGTSAGQGAPPVADEPPAVPAAQPVTATRLDDAPPVLRNHYVMDVVLDVEERSATVAQSATFINETGAPVTELWMHLYAAAFGNTHSTWMHEGGPDPVTDRGPEDGGSIEVRSVALGTGVDLTAATRIDDTLMTVALPEAVPPGGRVTLAIEFTTRFPRVIARMGATGEHIDGMQWFPKFCVHDEQEGWVVNQFHRTGEFFADFGSYEVTFRYPHGFTLEATGVPTQLGGDTSGLRVVRYDATDVHDFAFVIDPHAKVRTRTFTYRIPEDREVQIVYLCQPYALPKAEQVLDVVEDNLRDAGNWWMPYPYPRIVVDGLPHSLGGGMEYPMLFTISQRRPNHLDWLVDGTEDPASVTAHEFGHQYWYGILASNEFDEAWLDEGLNTYGTTRLMESHFPDAGRTDAKTFLGRAMVREFFNGAWQTALPFSSRRIGLQDAIGWRASPFHDTPPANPASSPTLLGWRMPGLNSMRLPDMSANRQAWKKDRYYEDAGHLPLATPSREFTRGYGPLVYSKTALVLETLRNHVGRGQMREIMRTYVQRWAFRHPTGEDFLAVVSELTDGAHDELMRQLVETADTVDYSVEQVSSRQDTGPVGFAQQRRPGDPADWRDAPEPTDDAAETWITRYVVQQLGELVAPVTIEARFEDGSVIRHEWDGAGGTRRFEHGTASKLTEVVVDPDRLFAIDLDVNNNGYRLEADRETTQPLVVLAHFWSQNVLNGWSFLF
jgi:hypothetical protein